uniref:Nicotinamide-nucleotide adenylyltransferase n=1 Tax=Strigamia maritima TaxID=126957 RepID=T1IIP7_STRMM
MNLPQPKVVLLACGSFNPVTNMHLRMFELAKDHLNKLGKYKVVSGIMSPVSDAYEKNGLVSSKHRCEMVQLAVKTSDWIKVDTWEAEQNAWTETRRVLEHHQNVLNSAENDTLRPSKRTKIDGSLSSGDVNNLRTQNSAVYLKLLCGADLLESFAKPGLWKDDDVTEIVSKYGLVVISREGSNPHKFIYESDVLSKYQNNIFIVTEWITNDISATKVRRALTRGDSVKYLIQDAVIDYINLHGLYGSTNK